MFGLIIGVIILLAGIITAIALPIAKPGKVIIAVVAIILAAVMVVMSCMGSVPVGHTGILTTFGKVESTHLDSGMYTKKPWQEVVELDNRKQVLTISSDGGNSAENAIETRDQQLVMSYEFEVHYQLNPEMSYVVYKNYGKNYEDKLITSNGQQFIKEVFALYLADEIVTSREKIPEEIKQRLSTVTEPLGVNIERINFVSYDFSPEYTAVLEQRALLNAQIENNKLAQQNETIAAQTQYDVAVKQAEKEAETQRIAAENANKIAIAQAEAQAETDRINAENNAFVTRTKAEAQKDARLAAAEAEKAELEAKSAGLNDYVIQQEFIQKWDGKLIPSFGDTGLGFTDYTDVIKGYLFAETESVGE